jgi:hypothetical protein
MENFTRFDLMDVGQEELRRILQSERQKKGYCEYCSSTKDVKWRQAATAYYWDDILTLEDPNRRLFLCDECSEMYYDYWNEMWKNVPFGWF